MTIKLNIPQQGSDLNKAGLYLLMQAKQAGATTKAVFEFIYAILPKQKVEQIMSLPQEQKQEWLVQEALEIINNFEAKEMYQHALDLLTQSIVIDKKSFEAHALAGYTYGLLKDYTNANAFLNKAEKFAGTNEEQIEIVSGLKEAVEAMQG